MKLVLNICFLLFISSLVKSQTDSLLVERIQIKGYENSLNSQKLIYKKRIKLDSINIKIQRFKPTIETSSLFEKSKSILEITYCLDNEELIAINIKEPSLDFSEYDIASYYDFYFDNGELILNTERYTIKGALTGIGIPSDKDKYDIFGYNRAFTSVFLLNYSKLLYDRILMTELE